MNDQENQERRRDDANLPSPTGGPTSITSDTPTPVEPATTAADGARKHIPYNPQQPNSEEEDREEHDDIGRTRTDEDAP